MSWDVLHRIGLKLRRLEAWPVASTAGSQRSVFNANISDTTKVLAKELVELRAQNAILELAISPEDLRKDGLPKSIAKLSDPGVILSMNTKFGPLRIYFNKFADWKDNLRAIALHLEHLRKASLYGVGRDGEQYAGWKYTAGKNESNTKEKQSSTESFHSLSTLSEAIAFLSKHSGMEINQNTVTAAYRKCALRLHPDATTGSHSLFIALQKAREIAYKHWHLKL